MSSESWDSLLSEREHFLEYFAKKLVEALAEMEVPQHKRASLLAEISGRSTQSAMKWLAGDNLPDLDSARRIFFKLQLDSQVMLGINAEKATNDESRYAWANANGIQITSLLESEPRLYALAKAVADNPKTTILIMQDGDEMAPDVCRGETIGVDTSNTSIVGSGLYLFRRKNRVFLRRAEYRIGHDSITLTCADNRYSPDQVSLTKDGHLKGVEVVGKVVFIVKKI